MVVLLAYSLFAVVHFFYTTATGWTPNAWDTAPEIVLLAMNSKPTKALRNTGAGIATVLVFKEKVKVRVKQDHLELVFDDTVDEGHVLRPNIAYG